MTAKALVVTLADPVAEGKGGTPCITLAHIKNEVVQPESDTFGNTGGF